MNKYWASIICTFLICITVVIVFFNPYHYSMYNGKYPVRDNWMNGKTEILGSTNLNSKLTWSEME